MKNCTSCNSLRIAHICGKCSDLFSLQYNNQEYDDNGYVIRNIEIGGGDYIEFSYCLDCGKIQGEFPVSEEKIEIYSKEKDDEDIILLDNDIRTKR